MNTSEGSGGEELCQCLAITNLAVVNIWETRILRLGGKESIPRSRIARAGSGITVELQMAEIAVNSLFQKLVSDLQDQNVWRRVPGWPQSLQQADEIEGWYFASMWGVLYHLVSSFWEVSQ